MSAVLDPQEHSAEDSANTYKFSLSQQRYQLLPHAWPHLKR